MRDLDRSSNLQLNWNLISVGKIKANELISHMIKPEETQSVYFGLLEEKDHTIKLLMDWRD